jgi:hypothetical protein
MPQHADTDVQNRPPATLLITHAPKPLQRSTPRTRGRAHALECARISPAGGSTPEAESPIGLHIAALHSHVPRTPVAVLLRGTHQSHLLFIQTQKAIDAIDITRANEMQCCNDAV